MIDVFVLFVLYSISSHRKAVERLFVNKVRAGCFNEELMNMVFGSHPEVRMCVWVPPCTPHPPPFNVFMDSTYIYSLVCD